MPKVYCGAVDCKWNDVKNQCRAKEIHLEDNYIMTVYDGRQHFNRCKDYEMSEQSKRLYEDFKRILKNDGIESIES